MTTGDKLEKWLDTSVYLPRSRFEGDAPACALYADRPRGRLERPVHSNDVPIVPTGPGRPWLSVLFAAVLTAVRLTLPVSAAEYKPPAWGTDLSAAFRESSVSGRPVLAFFYRPGRPADEQMRSDVLDLPQCARILVSFVRVAVDVRQQRSDADAYMVVGTPTLAVLEFEGEMGDMLTGLQSADVVNAFLTNALTAAGAAGTDKRIREDLARLQGRKPPSREVLANLVLAMRKQAGRDRIRTAFAKAKPFRPKSWSGC